MLYHVRNDTTKVIRGFAVEALRYNVDCPHSNSQADRAFDISKCERGFVPLEGSSSEWPDLVTSIKVQLGAQILAMTLFGMQCSYDANHIDFTMCSLLLLPKFWQFLPPYWSSALFEWDFITNLQQGESDKHRSVGCSTPQSLDPALEVERCPNQLEGKDRSTSRIIVQRSARSCE